MALYRTCFSDDGNPDTTEEGGYYDQILADDSVFFSLSDGEVTGCIALAMDESPTATLSGLAILPAWRRQGHARALLRHCRNLALDTGRTSVGLTVDVDNASAVALYSSEGYIAQGLPFLDTDGAMAVTMRLRAPCDDAGSDSAFFPFCSKPGHNLVAKHAFMIGDVVYPSRDEYAPALPWGSASP